MRLLLCMILMFFTPFLFAGDGRKMPQFGDPVNETCFEFSTASFRVVRIGEFRKITNVESKQTLILNSGNPDIKISVIDTLLAELPENGDPVNYCFTGKNVSKGEDKDKVVRLEFDGFEQLGERDHENTLQILREFYPEYGKLNFIFKPRRRAHFETKVADSGERQLQLLEEWPEDSINENFIITPELLKLINIKPSVPGFISDESNWGNASN